MTDEFRLLATIAAPPAAVFAALTDPAELRTWLASDVAVSLDAGEFAFWGRRTPQGAPGHQRLLGFEPGRWLTFAWRLDDIDTTVDIELAADSAGTSLTCATRRCPPWTSSCLPRVAGTVATPCTRSGPW